MNIRFDAFLNKQLFVCLLMSVFVVSAGYGAVEVDEGAALHQRPVILTTTQGVQQVNIQMPNSAGVSMNHYSRFDVDESGVVINNSRSTVESQTAGWVSANPNVGRGEARLIVNQVNSTDPSSLGGVIEITGKRADFVLANPNGISVNGATLINAGNAILTTGAVQQNSSGTVTGYAVNQGKINVEGRGLNAVGSDHVTLLSRAVELNAKLHAHRVDVIAGANQVSADLQKVDAIAGVGNQPSVSIDTKSLGGMYANSIRLVGTEQGLGIHNAGEIVAGDGELIITEDGELLNSGTLQSAGESKVNVGQLTNTSTGVMRGGVHQTITADTLTNAGRIQTDDHLVIKGNTVVNDQLIHAGKTLEVVDSGRVTNNGELLSGTSTALGTLKLAADTTNNTGLIQGGDVLIEDKVSLVNTGNIRAVKSVEIKGGRLENESTGSVYTSDANSSVKIDQDRVINKGKLVSNGTLHVNTTGSKGFGNAGVVASVGQLKVTGHSLHNTSSGELVTKDVFDIELSDTLHNQGKIESLGRGTSQIKASGVLNESTDVETNVLYGKMLDWWFNVWHRHGSRNKSGHRNDYVNNHGSLSVIMGEIARTRAAQLYSGGDLNITVTGAVDNLSSFLGASGDLNITAQSLNNRSNRYDGAQITYGYRVEHKDRECGGGVFSCGYHQDDPTKVESDGFWQKLDNGVWSFSYTPLRGGSVRPSEQGRQSVDIIGALSNMTARNITLNLSNSGMNTGVIDVQGGALTLTGQSRPNLSNTTSSDLGQAGHSSSGVGFVNGLTGNAVSAPSTLSNAIDLGVYLHSAGTQLLGLFVSNNGVGSAFANQIFKPIDLFDRTSPEARAAALKSSGSSAKGDRYRASLSKAGFKFYLDDVQERRVMRQALLSMLGSTRLLPGSEQAQMAQLLSNASDFAGRSGAQLGSALTPAQVASVTKPMVWYQNREINGNKVLMPFIYLPDTLVASLKKGTGAGAIRAQDASISLDGHLTNTGTLRASNTLTARVKNVLNEERTLTTVPSDMMVSTVSLGGGELSGGVVDLKATDDVRIKGGEIAADKGLRIAAGGDVDIAALKLGHEYHINSSSLTRDEKVVNHDVTQLSSGSGNLVVRAGKNLRAEGTQFNSDASMGLVAGGDVELASVKDERYVHTEVREKKDFGRKKSTATTSYDGTHRGVRIKGGKDLIIKSGNDMTLASVDAEVKGRGQIDAGGDLTVTADVNEQSNRTVVSKSNAARKKNTDRGSVTQTASTSQIKTGGHLRFNAGGDMTVVGSDLSSGQSLVMGDMNIKRDAKGKAIKAAGGGYETESGKTVKNLTVTGLALKNEQWDKTTRSLRGPIKELAKVATAVISFIPMAQGLGIKPEITLAESQETRTEVTTYKQSNVSGQNVYANVQDTALFEGAHVNATADKEGKGGNIVVLADDIKIDALETQRRDYTATSKETVKSLGVKAEKDQVSLGGVELKESKESTEVVSTDWVGSSFNGKNVSLRATDNVDVMASNISTLEDTIIHAGGDITVADRQATQTTTHRSKESTTTLSASLSHSASSAVSSALDTADTLGKSKNNRVNNMAGANTAWKGYQAANALKGVTPSNVGRGLSLNAGLSVQNTESEQVTRTSQSRGSGITAGGRVSLTASGGDKSSINIIGSDVMGAQGTDLMADFDVNLLAGKNTSSERSKNKSSGGGLGVGFSDGSLGINASANYSKGRSRGDSTTYRNSRVGDGKSHTTIKAGNKLALSGAQARGERITVRAKELSIESLQDTARYDSKQRSVSGNVTVGAGFSGGGSYNKSDIKANHKSVREQSGLLAGDGGFDVAIANRTELTGGIITSTAKAEGKNRFKTGSLDITHLDNVSEYNADAMGLSLNGGVKDPSKSNTPSNGAGKNTLSMGKSIGYGKDSDRQSNQTRSGIGTKNITVDDGSSTEGVITQRTTEDVLTDTGLANVFDKDAVQKEVDLQVNVTQQFDNNRQDLKKTLLSRADQYFIEAQEERRKNGGNETEKSRELEAKGHKLSKKASYIDVALGAMWGSADSTATAVKQVTAQHADYAKNAATHVTAGQVYKIDCSGSAAQYYCKDKESINGSGGKDAVWEGGAKEVYDLSELKDDKGNAIVSNPGIYNIKSDAFRNAVKQNPEAAKNGNLYVVINNPSYGVVPGLSEIVFYAGYDKINDLSGARLPLTNAERTNVNINKYAKTHNIRLEKSNHSRGGLTESISLKRTNDMGIKNVPIVESRFYGTATHVKDYLKQTKVNGYKDSKTGETTIVKSANHQADFVGRPPVILGGNPSTGGNCWWCYSHSSYFGKVPEEYVINKKGQEVENPEYKKYTEIWGEPKKDSHGQFINLSSPKRVILDENGDIKIVE